MERFRILLGSMLLCVCANASAQYDNYDTVDDWTLEDIEEEVKPQHKEWKNSLYIQYSPSRYLTNGKNTMHFNEVALGYFHSFQIMEDMPYFIEVGANIKYSHSTECANDRHNLLSFRVPINATYKIYLHKTKNIALAPYAGPHVRAIAASNVDYDWKAFQIGWQVGMKFYWERCFMGISYARDFPDDGKTPHVYESGVHVGYCF